MDISKLHEGFLGRINPRLLNWAFKYIKKLPSVKKELEKEFEPILKELETFAKPYRKDFTTYSRIPAQGCDHEDILGEMAQLNSIEEGRWKEGFASGAVYHGDSEHINFLNNIYAVNSQSNPLHSDICRQPAGGPGRCLLGRLAGCRGGRGRLSGRDPSR